MTPVGGDGYMLDGVHAAAEFEAGMKRRRAAVKR